MIFEIVRNDKYVGMDFTTESQHVLLNKLLEITKWDTDATRLLAITKLMDDGDSLVSKDYNVKIKAYKE